LPEKNILLENLPKQLSLESPLELVEHVDDFLGEPHGFGSFLFNTNGQILLNNGMTWLYTTALTDGKWESWARPFHVDTMKTGPAERVLVSMPEDLRGAVLHHVIRISPDFAVGFFSNGKGIRAATAHRPNAYFQRDLTFMIDPVKGWETRNGNSEVWALEANGAFVNIHEDDHTVIFWEGYDSYQATGKLGDLAWVKIKIDKHQRRISNLERHPGNPLRFRDSTWSCARCGGNLSGSIRIDGKYGFFYYFRPINSSDVFIALALCRDPLFQKDVTHYLVDHMRGREMVAEKFQAVMKGRELLLFSENRLKDGAWYTGLRRFLILK